MTVIDHARELVAAFDEAKVNALVVAGIVPLLIDEVDQLRARLVEAERERDEARKHLDVAAQMQRERDEAVRELTHMRAMFAEVKHQRDCYMRAAAAIEHEEF